MTSRTFYKTTRWKLELWGRYGGKVVSRHNSEELALSALLQAEDTNPDGWYLVTGTTTWTIR